VSDADGFRAVLDQAHRVHVDASVLALHLTGNARFTPLTRLLFERLADGALSGCGNPSQKLDSLSGIGAPWG